MSAPRQWLSIPADDDTVELVASVLDAGAAARRRASLAIAEELVAERRDAKRDIRSGAVKLAEVMAEASVLEKVASDVRQGDVPALPADEWDPAVLAALTTATGYVRIPATVEEGDPPAHGTASPPGPVDPDGTAQAVELDDGRTAWVPPPEVVEAALGTDDLVPEVDDADVEPLDLGAE